MTDKFAGGIKAGSTDVSIVVMLRSTTDNTEVTGKTYSDFNVSYWRQGGTRQPVTEATLGSVDAAHTNGGIIEVDATNMPGVYRLDLPDEAVAANADWVMVSAIVSGAYAFVERYELTSNVVQTGDSYTRLGAPIAASISADIAVADANVDTILGRVTAAVATASSLSTVASNVSDILTDTSTTIPSTLSGLATSSALSTHDGKLDTVDTNVDTLITRVTGAVALSSELATHDGKLDIVDTNVDTLVTRITNDRATYLDNLSAGAVATASALSTHDSKLDTVDTVVDAIFTDTDSTIPTTLSGLATASALSTHDGKLDTVDTNVDTLITRVTGAVALASSLTSVAGDVTSILEDTGTTIPNTLSGLNDIAAGDVWDVVLATHTTSDTAGLVLNMLTQDSVTLSTDVALGSIIGQMLDNGTAWSFDRSTDSLEAIRNEGDSSWGSGSTNPNVLLSSEINTVASQTSFTMVDGSTDDDAYNGQAIVIYDDSNSDYPSVRVVSDYTGSTKTVTIDEAPDFTMGTDDSVRIFVTAPGTSAPTAGQVADAVWDEATSGHTSAGTFGLTNQTAVPSSTLADYKADVSALATASALSSVASNVSDILTDTGTTLPNTLSTLATASALTTVGGNVAGILEDTSTTIPVTLSGLATSSALASVASNVTDILTDTSTTLPATLATISGYCDVLDDGTNGLVAIKAEVEGLGGEAMRGTDNAATASALSTHDGKLDTVDTNVDTLITRVTGAVALASTLSTVDGKIDIIDGIVDDILEDTGTSLVSSISGIDTKIDTVDTVVDAIKVKTDNLPSGIAKGVALPKVEIFMVLSSDHVTGATGKTVTGYISKDGGAFASITNAITEVAQGIYTIASGLTATEMNADVVILRFTATDCDDRLMAIYTTA